PNNTAWCKAVEEFLFSLGFGLRGEHNLRRPFENALRWYSSLKHLTSASFSSLQPSISTSISVANTRKRVQSDSAGSEASTPSSPFPTPDPRDRPLEYLRRRCPLCFGGEFPSQVHMEVDAVVCLDACFTQKRNKGPRDPERRQRNVPTGPDDPESEDVCEDYLAVPNSVLNGCEASFTAADERREKASTQFFDDTALMALLCRHDRVLWIANMRSAGEKQHYTLVLLETLFQHLPLIFKIGLLYDI
ncbi:hypothetical protein BDN72DRAFT_733400, partial [Pluteus cervinus]